MDTIKFVSQILVLAAVSWGASLAAQEVAYPRYSPLPVYGPHPEDDETSKLSIEFGEGLSVVEVNNNTVLVSLPNEGMARVKLADVVLSDGLEYIIPGPNFQLKDRARLSFWDSKLRAQGFLQNGPSVETSPLLNEVNATENAPALPVLNYSLLRSSLGGEIYLSQSLVPASDDLLDILTQNEKQDFNQIELHIVLDGSTYARDFAQRRLHAFSRQVETSDNLKQMALTRTVILENGKTVGPEEIQISGLRQILPQNPTSNDGNGAFSDGFIEALRDLTDLIEEQEASDRLRIIIMLLGPGVRKEILDDPEFTVISRALRQKMRTGNFGIMVGSITPEPSEIPKLFLTHFGISIPNKVLGFADQLDHSISNFLDEISALSLAKRRDAQLCYFDKDHETFCLLSENMQAVERVLAVPEAAPLDWLAVPLWHIIDGATLVYNREPAARANSFSMPAHNDKKIIKSKDILGGLEKSHEDQDGLFERQSSKSLEIAVQVAKWNAKEADLVASLKEVIGKQEELRSELVLAHEDVANLETRLKEANEQNQKGRSHRAHLQRELEVISASLHAAESQNRMLEKSLSGLAEEKILAEQRVSEILTENSRFNSKLNEMNTVNAALRGVIAKQDGRVENIRQELLREQSKTANLTKELLIATDDQVVLGAIINEQNLQIEELERQRLSLEALVEEKDVQIASLDTEVSDVKAEYDLIIKAAEVASAQSEELKFRTEELARWVQELENQNSDLLENENFLTDQLSWLKLKITNLEDMDSEKNMIILELQRKNDALKSIIDSASAKTLAVNQELTKQKNSYSKLEINFNDVKAKLSEFAEENVQLRTLIQATEARVVDLQSERDKALTLLNDRSKSFVQIQNALQSVEGLLSVDVSDADLPTVTEKYKRAVIAAKKQFVALSDAQHTKMDQIEINKVYQTDNYAEETARLSSEVSESRRAIFILEERLAEREMELSDLKKEKVSLSGRVDQHVEQASQVRSLLRALAEQHAIDISYRNIPDAINKFNEIVAETLDQRAAFLRQKQFLEAELMELKQAKEHNLLKKDELIMRLEQEIENKDDNILLLEAEISSLSSENSKLFERIKVAMGVAEENVQLLSAIKSAERMWLEREATLQNEIKLLNQKLRQAYTIDLPSDEGDANAQIVQPAEQNPDLGINTLVPVASLRPVLRPQNLTVGARSPSVSARPTLETSQPSPSRRVVRKPPDNVTSKPDALAGSLFVEPSAARTTSGGFQKSGGFFGN